MIPQKKKNVLYKAIELFNEFGYANVGIDRIISESNVAKMTFYKYFPSKDILITECLMERDDLIRSSILENINKTSNNIEPLLKLKAIFDWFENWFYQDDFYGCMFIKALGQLPFDHKSLEVSKAHKNWLIDQINSILKCMNIIDYEKISIQICLLLDGAIVHEQLFRDQIAINSAWNMTVSMLSKKS